MEESSTAKNEMLKSAIVSEYKNFVDSVEPSEVVDILIQERVMTTEEWNKLATKETRQEKCRFLLDKIFTTANPKSCIILCQALQEYYPWIHEKIMKKFEIKEKLENSPSTLNVREFMERLEISENKQLEKLKLLEEKEKKIKYLESFLSNEDMEYMSGDRSKNGGILNQSYETKIQELQSGMTVLQIELKDKKLENSNLTSHVMILEAQIMASASRIKSQDNILDFDDGTCESMRVSLKPDCNENEVSKEGLVRIINPEEVIKVTKLPRYCGTYYDLYNGRFGNECLTISIKELLKETDEAKEDRLRKEAGLTCQLNHPRLTKLLGQSGDSPVSFIIYESSYIPNALNYLKYKCDNVTESLVIRWCVQLACALEYTSSRHILLRNIDLKNVLVVSKGKSIKLTNFDSAVKIPDGCDCYMDDADPSDKMEKLAPEVWRDRQWFKATDVWSFALTALKLYCRGACLFPRQTERDIKSLLGSEDSLFEHLPCCKKIKNVTFKQTVAQCLSHDHHLRPSIEQLSVFTAYDSFEFTCAKVKELMVDTYIEHVIENKMQVRSITTLNNYLYFIVNSSSSIKCYHMANGYERFHSIKLGLSRRNTLRRLFKRDSQQASGSNKCTTPSQKLLSICAAGESLFVLDGENCGVWCVAATKRKVLNFLKVSTHATSIQTSSDGNSILVFCMHPTVNGFFAEEYTLDGKYIRNLLSGLGQQPLYGGLCIDPLHMLVMCGHKQVISGHKQEDEPTLHLSVIDDNGSLSSGYGTLRFRNISDFCIHRPSQTILLADLSKNRILLVDPHLQSEPLLLFGVEQGITCPTALHIASDGSLFVGLVSGNVCCFHYKNLNTPSVSS